MYRAMYNNLKLFYYVFFLLCTNSHHHTLTRCLGRDRRCVPRNARRRHRPLWPLPWRHNTGRTRTACPNSPPWRCGSSPWTGMNPSGCLPPWPYHSLAHHARGRRCTPHSRRCRLFDYLLIHESNVRNLRAKY